MLFPGQLAFSRKLGDNEDWVTTKTKRLRKKRAKERNRAKEAAAQAELQHNLETSHLHRARKRRLLGIGSRGVSLTLHFDEAAEVPYDPADPVGSVERAQELSGDWKAQGYPTAGDA